MAPLQVSIAKKPLLLSAGVGSVCLTWTDLIAQQRTWLLIKCLCACAAVYLPMSMNILTLVDLVTPVIYTDSLTTLGSFTSP